MSRHRNIRSMNYNEEYDTYYDEYGQSVEEDCCISPGTAAQFMYDRTGQGQSHSMSAYLDEDEPEPLPEEPEEEEENLSAFDQARLRSCIEEIQNVVGETVSEAELKQAVIRNDYDLNRALDSVLTKEEPKPQRVKRERNRQEQSLNFGFGSEGSFLSGSWGVEQEGTQTLSELLGNADDSQHQTLSQLLGNYDSEAEEISGSEVVSCDNGFGNLLDSKSESNSLLDGVLISNGSNSWNNIGDKELSLSDLADLCQPLGDDQLGLTLSELSLSELALNPEEKVVRDGRQTKECLNRTFKIASQYLLNFPHDLPVKNEKVTTSLDITNAVNSLNILNHHSSCFGLLMCLRVKHSNRTKSFPVFKLQTVFDFNSASPDDETLLKRQNVETAGRKKEEIPVIENHSQQPIPANSDANIPPEVEEPKPTVTLTTDKQPPQNRPPTQHLSVETAPVKSGSRNSSRSPSPAPNVATPTLPKKNMRVQESSDPNEVYSKERSSRKPLLNLVVIGHVDAGKSTLMGHLLYRLGCVSKKTMHKNEQDSKKMGKSSFMYAWVLDETPEERSRGITMDIAQSRFETPHRCVTLLDAPGHRDFIPNMITGAAQADNAILVVDGTRGEFEAGFEAGGQTREHTLLVRSLGVSQLAVVVNKMDNEGWSEDRYNGIVTKMASFLKQAGFKDSDVQFVPCSGLTGENLTSPLATDNPKVTWYKGPCLLDIIDNFPAPARPISLPFRLSIADIFKGQGSGFCVGGRVESGLVQNGDKVLVMPAGETATVKGISQEESVNLQTAFAGDHVSLTLSGIDMNKVMCGDVVCDTQKPILASQRFRGRIVTFNLPVPLTQGCPVVLHYQSMSEQAVVKRLISQLHKGTGQVIKKKPRCLPKNASGIIELEVCRPICVELYKDNRDLGRFMLRAGGATVAAGVVTQVL